MCAHHDSDTDLFDYGTPIVAVEQADPVAVMFNDLIRRGKIESSQILYKYLCDVCKSLDDPFHPYDENVIEFFNSLTHIGGRSVANLLRGPMLAGQGTRSHTNPNSITRINLGGPSENTCAKLQAGYTNDPGVWTPLSLAQFTLLLNSDVTAFVETDLVRVFACLLSNDGTV